MRRKKFESFIPAVDAKALTGWRKHVMLTSKHKRLKIIMDAKRKEECQKMLLEDSIIVYRI